MYLVRYSWRIWNGCHPTFLFFKEGKMVEKHVGGMEERTFINIIKKKLLKIKIRLFLLTLNITLLIFFLFSVAFQSPLLLLLTLILCFYGMQKILFFSLDLLFLDSQRKYYEFGSMFLIQLEFSCSKT
jgi:hypothetical protein